MLLNAQERTGNQTSQIQTPYAIVRLEEAARIIKQSINELPALRRRLEKNMDDKTKARDVYGDLQNQHRRLLGAFDTAALSLLEAEQDDLANHSVKLGQSIKSFNLMTPDYTKLCAVLNNYLSSLSILGPIESGTITDIAAGNTSAVNEAQTTNSSIIGRLMNNVRMGYYPTCTDNLGHIVSRLDFPEGINVNLLDPCCGCGLALSFLAERVIDNGVDCKTYGIELDNYRAEEALTRVDRVGFGSYFHSRISNEAFHAMLLNPPYLSVMTESGSNARSEKSFLVDSISNLMMGGLLIYIIPYYRLTADIARILCDNFSDISVWRFTGSEFKKFKQVAILGTRHKKRDGSDMAPSLSSLALEPNTLPQLPELPIGRYQLPNISKDVALFKGAQFNEAELANQLSNSKSFSRLFQRSELDNIEKRPLLPLSIGQIGLVGGSGLINGLVECDTPHIIKGRIVKEKRTNYDENNNDRGDLMSTTLTETISNKLIFNILTRSGFMSLTDYGNIGAVVDADNDQSDDDDSLLGYPDSCNSDEAVSADNTLDKDSEDNAGKKLLQLGRTVVARDAREVLTDYDINSALLRHRSGDWGNVSESDWKSNDNAVKRGDRVLSSYLSLDGVEFWVITEHDRSYTTTLLPEEY